MALKDLDLSALERIVIVKPSSLGDIVHTLPVLYLLRKAAPQAHISWVVNTVWAPLLEGHELLDEVIEFPREKFRGFIGSGRAWLAWKQQQSHRQPDLALDVQGLMRSAFLICRSLNAKRIIGYSDAREGAHLLHHESVDVSLKRSPHAVDRYLTFFQELGMKLPSEVSFPLPAGKPMANVETLPDTFLLLHPFSRGKGKSLTGSQVEQFIEQCDGIPIVLVGHGVDEDLSLPPHVVNLLNQTSLQQLIWLIRQASWVVSVDSGPMHLAAAITPNLLSLHTWSDPLKVGPYLGDAWIWKSGRICQKSDYQTVQQSDEPREFPSAAIPALASFVQQRWEA